MYSSYNQQTDYLPQSSDQNSLNTLSLISSILVFIGSGISLYIAYQSFKK